MNSDLASRDTLEFRLASRDATYFASRDTFEFGLACEWRLFEQL
jgi:hypothetical protein